MADVCLILHLHNPYFPAPANFTNWGNIWADTDLEATQHAFLAFNDRLLDPLASMLRKTISEHEVSLGLTVSGPLMDQWKRWAPDSKDAWQQVWKSPQVEILPRPWHQTPEIIWDRDEWLAQIQQYREEMSLSGARLSPVSWNPGYLFIQYLAWPLQHTGIQAALVDGESFGWNGSPSNRVSRIPFQHSFRVLTRNSGWSRPLEELNALRAGASPGGWSRQVVADLHACKESPVVLGIDLSMWMEHPAYLGPAIAGLEMILKQGADAGLRWQSPGEAITLHEPSADFPATDWVVLPPATGILGNRDHHPLQVEIIDRWRHLNESNPMGKHLIDLTHLRSMNAPHRWVHDHIGVSGQVFARIMRLFAWRELHGV